MTTRHAFWGLIRRELRSVTRERTIMIAIIIQLVIASFSSAFVMGLIAYYDPEAMARFATGTVDVGVLNDVDGTLTGILRWHRVDAIPFDSVEAADEAVREGVVEALIRLPDGAAAATSGDAASGADATPVAMDLYLPASESESTVALMVLQAPLKAYENELRARHGINVRYTDVRGAPPTTFEFIYGAIVPILMFFPAFVAGSMTVDSIAEEFENHTLDTLLSAPVTVRGVFGAKIVAALLVAVAQAVLWVLLLRMNRIYIAQPVPVLALSALVAAINTVAVAFLVLWLRDRERAQFVYSLLIVVGVGGSTLLGASPVTTMTRLATGDPFTGWVALLPYVASVGTLLIAFLLAARPAVIE
jgi:ABC-type Na+ efflux pump permease subunit